MIVWLVVSSILLAIAAGVLASVDAAVSSFSRARALELSEENRGGAERLGRILDDPAPYLNSVLLLRVLCETASIVLVALVVANRVEGLWTRILLAVGIMVVVSYVLIGVGPRTLGRQNAERIALASALPVVVATRLLGPLPRLLIVVGNALTPGKGFREGPFASEVEVRELVDLAAASSLIETDESRMIQSVFDLNDTVAREVMVPRTDLVYIEAGKTLRQAMSLCLRSGFSRIPVIADHDLDDIVGMAYLKDVTKRVFDNRAAESTEKVESIMRPCLFVPDTKVADDLLKEMQAQRTHVAIVVDEYGGTAGMVTIEDILEEIVGEITDEYDSEPDEVETLADGSYRVSTRYDVDDLADLFDVRIDEDVDSVGGLLAKHLGKVPIPGSSVEVAGLTLRAEAPSGRRNRIGRVHVSRIAVEQESVASAHAVSTEEPGRDDRAPES